MLSYYDLRKGIQFVLEGQPYEVLDFHQMRKAQDVTVAQTKIRNLISGKVIERNFHLGDTFQEADIQKTEAKFLYGHRGKYVLCDPNNPAKRFELQAEQLGDRVQFLKPGTLVTQLLFESKVITIVLPIKVQLKVAEAPPGVKGDRAQGGVKTVTLETGAILNVPLFVEAGDIIEVNTETGEYVRRV